jgi:hypothetical protein
VKKWSLVEKRTSPPQWYLHIQELQPEPASLPPKHSSIAAHGSGEFEMRIESFAKFVLGSWKSLEMCSG